MESLPGRIWEYLYKLIVFLSNLSCENFFLDRTPKVFLTAMYLTSGVAFEKPGLQIDLFLNDSGVAKVRDIQLPTLPAHLF